MDFDRLIELLPQKPPFLFLDHVVTLAPMRSVEGSVTFPDGHPIFENHLPGEPLVPGVIVVEALAQLAGIALIGPEMIPVRGYLAEVGQTRFHRLIHPDEEILLRAEVEQAFGAYARFRIEATVDGEQAATGRLTLARKERQ